jgi:hypothetical protein
MLSHAARRYQGAVHVKIWGWPADDGGCAWYRIQTPLGTLDDDDVGMGTVMPNSVLDEPDRLVVLQRSTAPKAMMVLDEFQQAKRPWVYDADDLLWGITPDNPAYNHYANPTIAKRLRWHVTNAPLFTVSTPTLANEALDAGAKWVAVVPNTLPDHLFDYADDVATKPRSDERLVVVWRGSPTHGEDVKVLRYAAKRLQQREDVRLVFVGADYRKDLGVPDAELLPWVPSPEAHVKRLIDLRPDVALCPLAHTRFNASKSHVNALEGAIAGALPVCSNVPAYQDFVAHTVDGLLLSNSPDAWWRALRSLADAGPWEIDRDAIRDNARRFRASLMKDQYRGLLESVG